MLVTVLPEGMPATAVGVEVVPVAPRPVRPLPALPQQYAVPSATAHVKSAPALTSETVLFANVVTRVGVDVGLVVPGPSAPPALVPQQYSWPRAIPHAWVAPALMSVSVRLAVVELAPTVCVNVTAEPEYTWAAFPPVEVVAPVST